MQKLKFLAFVSLIQLLKILESTGVFAYKIETMVIMHLYLMAMMSFQFFPLLLKLIAWNGEK